MKFQNIEIYAGHFDSPCMNGLTLELNLVIGQSVARHWGIMGCMNCLLLQSNSLKKTNLEVLLFIFNTFAPLSDHHYTPRRKRNIQYKYHRIFLYAVATQPVAWLPSSRIAVVTMTLLNIYRVQSQQGKLFGILGLPLVFCFVITTIQNI